MLHSLGTEEATSCNMVVLHSTITGKTSVGHFDGSPSQEKSIHAMLATFDKNEVCGHGVSDCCVV